MLAESPGFYRDCRFLDSEQRIYRAIHVYPADKTPSPERGLGCALYRTPYNVSQVVCPAVGVFTTNSLQSVSTLPDRSPVICALLRSPCTPLPGNTSWPRSYPSAASGQPVTLETALHAIASIEPLLPATVATSGLSIICSYWLSSSQDRRHS